LSIGEPGVSHDTAWSYFQSIDRRENREFADKLRARFGARRVVSDPMETVYFGVHLWAQAVQAAESFEPRAMVGFLQRCQARTRQRAGSGHGAVAESMPRPSPKKSALAPALVASKVGLLVS
jgi:ABC-type branched-subunit amino acid transport system substrate-binding protein